MQNAAIKAALEFYRDSGVDVCMADAPINRIEEFETALKEKALKQAPPASAEAASLATPAAPIIGKSEARNQAAKIAAACETLEELSDAIAQFDGISIKRTATNMVYGDGNSSAPIMLIGEAPAADEDRQGKPFVGVSGQLQDKILSCIGIHRDDEQAQNSIYITNMINWRPPGNRSPNAAEIEVSMPFIERHIQIVNPKIIIFCGGLVAKTLLNSNDSISKLRKKWHTYETRTPELPQKSTPIISLATYHPSYLLQMPAHKKAVWADMLMLQQKRRELELI